VITDFLPKSDKTNEQIIIPYELRTFIGDNGIIFHKSGDKITDNTSSHQLEFPFTFNVDWNTFLSYSKLFKYFVYSTYTDLGISLYRSVILNGFENGIDYGIVI
jgi:hypothetical protein